MNVIKEIFGKEQRTISYASSEDKMVKRTLINTIELLTGRRRIERVYRELNRRHANGAYIWDHIFDLLEIELKVHEEDLKNIPDKGSLLLISNHPFGVADGLALGYLLSRKRDDFYIIVNEVLCREEILGKYLLPIDFSGTREALRINLNTRIHAIEFLQKEGAVAIFPSGGVATAPRPFSRAIDLEWKNFVIKIVRKTSAHIVPVFFGGQNSPLFQLASQVNMNLRLGLLLNELNNKRHKSLPIQIGQPIDRSKLDGLSPTEMLSFLKSSTLSLGARSVSAPNP